MSKKFFLSLILPPLLASCSWMKGTAAPEENTTSTKQKIIKVLEPTALPPKDRELQRLARYLDQADAVHREAWWVVAADRKPPGKTIFGKVQRGLAQELKQKLTNKTLFSCDRYLVKRDIESPSGLPQKGSVMESCRAGQATHLADFDLKSKDEAVVVFQGQNLGEALGLGTAILNKYITCSFKGDEEGRLTDLTCKDLSQDRNATQSLNFSVYEYHRGNKNLLKLRGQVVEALYPIRKFEADVPLEGKIQVVETQTEAPEGTKVKPAPAPAKPTEQAQGQSNESEAQPGEQNAGVRGGNGGKEAPPKVLVRPTRQQLDPDIMRQRESQEGVSVEEQMSDMNQQHEELRQRQLEQELHQNPQMSPVGDPDPGYEQGNPQQQANPQQQQPAPPRTPSRR